MTKQELRKLYQQKRLALSEAEYVQLNSKVYQQFFAHVDLSFISVIHTFLPIATKHEVDTWPIVDRLKREFPHIRISIPKVDLKTHTLINFYFEGLHQLETNSWGVQEPNAGMVTEPLQIDMVLIPLLAWDKKGHRVGYGKGFYDKFLDTCRPDTRKIGLSLFSPEESILDLNSWDKPMDSCISPQGIYTF